MGVRRDNIRITARHRGRPVVWFEHIIRLGNAFARVPGAIRLSKWRISDPRISFLPTANSEDPKLFIFSAG